MKWATMNQQIELNGQYKSARQKWANLFSLIFTAQWAAFLFYFLMHLSWPTQVLRLSFWGQFHWPQQHHVWLERAEQNLTYRVPFHTTWWDVLMTRRLRERNSSEGPWNHCAHEIPQETFWEDWKQILWSFIQLVCSPFLINNLSK